MIGTPVTAFYTSFRLPSSRLKGPLWLRDALDEGSRHIPDLDYAEEEQTHLHPALYCKFCGRLITSERERMEAGGSHRHTFCNPAGIVFEIGCFRKAPGCIVRGETSDEFSWFAGYVWSFALCGGCNTHLGWYFTSGDMSFFGLILQNLSSGNN